MIIIIINNSLGQSMDQMDVAAKEATLVFHTICENQSFNSMTCLSKLIRTVFGEKKFACSRTKSTAIVRNVFHPMVTESIRNELSKVRFICSATDSSNHGSTKLYPVVFRYFITLEGVRTRMVDLITMPGEKAIEIKDMLVKVLNSYDCAGKLIGFCGDNCPTNFGRPITRTGSNNVFYLLQQEYDDGLLGIGCLAHMLHNAINFGCTVVLPHDMEAVIVKFYKHFYIYSQRTEALRVLCESKDVLFEKLKSYGATRFVAMKECLTTIINLFDVLVEYFNENSNETPVVLRRFLEDPLALFLLQFLRDSCENFESTILKVEGDKICAVEALISVLRFKRLLENQLENNFLSISAMDALRRTTLGESSLTQEVIFSTIVRPFYGMIFISKEISEYFTFSFISFYPDKCSEYLNDWLQPIMKIEHLDWILLDKLPQWNEIDKSCQALMKTRHFAKEDHQKLFIIFESLKSFVTTEKVKSWNDTKTAVDDRWVEFFKSLDGKQNYAALSSIVEYALCTFGKYF